MRQKPKRRLILGLDGVPWQIINELRSEGRFSLFHQPTKLISPFPTMTNVGMTTLLRTSRTLGYESLYFDRTVNALKGGVKKYIGKRRIETAPRGYNSKLNYEEPLPFEFLGFVMPERIFHADFDRFLEKYNRSSATNFYAFLKSTDALTHITGRHLLQELRFFDDVITELFNKHEGALEIVLFSDHGNALVPHSRIPLESHLRRQGMKMGHKFDHPRSVVSSGFGLCSFVPIYTPRDNIKRTAECLVELEGVDFSVYRVGDNTVELRGPSGIARIHHNREQNSYSYERVQGDLLQLGQINENIPSKERRGAEGYVRDEVWFELTKDHRYPDALANFYRAVDNHISYPADMIVSLKEGYCYGKAIFSMIVNLAATHGSGLDSTSFAILMSTHQATPSHLRAADAHQYLF